MALKIWLPLNGNLENKGISDITVINNGATINNSGKIGKCYTFNSNNIVLNGVNLSNISALSVACWIKNTNTSSTQTIINCRKAVGNGLAVFLLGGKIRFDIGNANCTFNWTYNFSNWTHICCTVKGNVRKLYVNGVLQEETTVAATYDTFGTIASIGMSSANTASPSGNILYADLNDFRLYDHCLSTLEVKEISQGLILHYKLDNVESSQNLITTEDCFDGATCYNGATSKYGYGTNTDMYKTTGVFQGKKSTKVYMGTAGLNAYPYVYFNPFSAVGTTVHTLSFDYFPTSQDKLIPYSYNGAYDWTYTVNGVVGSATNATTCPTLTVNLNQWNHIEITARKTDTTNTTRGIGYIRIGSAKHTSTTTDYWLFANVQVEEKDHATSYMGVGGIRNIKVVDSSGYGHNGIISTSASNQSNSGRYNGGVLLDKKKITRSSGFFTTADPIFTISFWFKIFSNITYTSYADLVSFEATNSSQLFRLELCGSPAGNNLMWFRGPTGTSGGFNAGPSSSGWCSKDVWHQIALVSHGNKQYTCYFDGVQTNTYDGSANSWTPVGSLGIGDTAEGTAEFADYRIYATALSADDILALYNNPANIDKSGKFHTFEFIENNNNSIKKNGIIQCNEIIEETIPSCQYDSQIYTEPDGSKWIHIYHINNPGAGSFASTDTFATGVYKDANRWYDATRVCNQLSKWEFMVKYAFTSGGTEYKERWIQSKNPENAVFGDVDAADITRITTSGYKAGTWGGLYKKNASAYWVMNNGNSGNWWGATGGFSVYQSGTPGYGGTVTTTGYNDLYVRIDNIQTNARITKTGNYIGSGFIEK